MNPPIQTKKDHFHFGHLGIILACAVLLVGVSFFKNGFNFKSAQKARADGNQQILTYDQAKAQVDATTGLEEKAAEQQLDQDVQSKVALLDPGQGNGQVLGTSTDLSGMFPKAQDVFTPDVLSVIKIKQTNDDTKEAMQKYAEQVLNIESRLNSFQLLADLNSSDTKILSQINNKAKLVIQNLGQLSAPPGAGEFHRMKILYYTTLGNIGANLAGEKGVTDMDNGITLLFSVTERLEDLKQQIFANYQVQL